MSTASSHESYIAKAQKIHTQILSTYEETAQSIDKLKSETTADQLYLFRAANVYANDLNKVVFNLAQVAFKIDKSKHARRDLQHVIDTLCELAGAVHRSFHYDHEKFKSELKNNIKSATYVAERLLALIYLDDIHEHKQEILNNQADVLFAVDRVLLTNQIKFLNPQQLQDVAQTEVDKIKTILLSFAPKDSNIGNKLIQCTKHALEKLQNYNTYLNKAVTGDHFNDKIKNMLLDLFRVINKNVVDLHEIVLKSSQIENLIDDLHKNMTESFGGFTKLILLLTAKENEQVTDSGMELLVYAYGVGIGNMFQMRRNLEYVKADY